MQKQQETRNEEDKKMMFIDISCCHGHNNYSVCCFGIVIGFGTSLNDFVLKYFGTISEDTARNIS